MAYNRQELRDLIRQRLGWPDDDTFVTDAELNSYINDSLRELFELLSTMHGPMFMVEKGTFSTVSGQADYDTADVSVLGSVSGELPRVLRMHADLGGTSLTPFRRGNVATHVFDSSTRGWSHGTEVTYFITWQGDLPPVITFDPVPRAVHTVTIWYQEQEVTLADDVTDTVMGHEDYVLLDCCIKCRTKEESDTSDLVAQKTAYQARMERLSRPLDIGQPPTIADARTAFSGVSQEESWWRR